MAFNLENMTVDYKKLLNLVPTQRMQLAQSGALNDLISALTPGQLASMFPSYYRNQLPDVGLSSPSGSSTAGISGAMSGAGGYRPSGGGTYSPTSSTALKKTPTPEEKAVQELMSKAGITTGPANAKQNKQYLLDAMNKGGVADPEIRAAMMAVVKGETQFLNKSEDSYAGSSADRIREVFKRTHRFDGMSDADIDELKKNPEAFFNHVYGSRIGNAANEGYKYRGRGFFQLTGKANYERYGNMIGVDLVSNPDLANDPQIAAQIAVEYIKDRYTAASGNSEREKVFRAVGASVPGTEEVKNAAYNEYLQTGEFAPDKVAQIESEVAGIQDLSSLPPFDSSMITQLDERLQKWYEKAEGMQKKNFEIALQKLGTEQFNETMKKQPVNSATLQAVGDTKSLEQRVAVDDEVMLGNKPFIEGNDFAVPIYTNAKGGKRFDENLEGLTPQAIERLKQQAIAAKAAGLSKLELYGAQTQVGHVSHSAGTETDVVGYNEDGSAWSRDQRATTALGAVQMGGANRVGLYGGQGLHVGMADEVAGGPGIEAAWGPGGKTSGVSVNEFTPGLERDLAAYLKGQGPMPESNALNEHLQKMKEKRDQEIAAKAEEVRTASPVSAAGVQAEEITANSAPVPAMATGGLMNVPPGENIVGLNTTTGKTEFVANDRENIRVDPATLEDPQKMPLITQEDTQRLESPNQPLAIQPSRPMQRDNPDPNFYSTMGEGDAPVPPSQLRAANRARLYGENSGSLVNGHFS